MSIFGTGKPSFFLTSTINISGATHSSGWVTITTSSAHGLTNNNGVLIEGVSGMTDINGAWQVTYINSTQFKIQKTTAQTYISGGTIRKGVLLTYSFIDYNFIEPDQLNYKSVINGLKTNTHLGDYGSFKIITLLWKYSSPSGMFSEIYNYYHTNVYFLPHSNKGVLDSGSNWVGCYLKNFRPFYYKNLRSYDAVELILEPTEYYDITKLVV